MAKNDYQLGQAKMNVGRGGGRWGRVPEKPKDFKSAVKALLKYLRAYIPQIGIALVAAMLSVIMALFGPDNLSKITDLIDGGMDAGYVNLDETMRLTVLVLLFYGFSAILVYVQRIILVKTAQSIMRQMRMIFP